ncbi:helix-turn-helix transcriptional regulator [Alkalihalobacillus pseudalcaliphilus]|uniref:helix-turn-helix transcriptional regulator n=1 Tax=Alkalihalobacillus pseudalcaliphilus TaxID=79884 RepID=UPI00064D72DB|nr:helix-turn-helix transcriptional regulator [Alkalihalobacillus pseudalcaliphilus]KMK78206.1 hypothetical protein AB990_01860 [Alkalihalobacillus pseudalcaliphilus]
MIANWQKELSSIIKSENVNENLFEMIKVFYQNFPCRIIQLFQYSSFNDAFSGIISYEYPNVQSIHYVHEMAKVNRFVYEALSDNKVSYFDNNAFQLSISNHFILSEPIKNMLVIPFTINDIVVGFMTGVNVQLQVGQDVLNEMKNFSEQCLHFLYGTRLKENTSFTNKELQVMQYIANGFTTKEISNMMYLAESTVKYFLKNVMVKTDSANRTEAVTKLFRLQLLH